LMKLPEDCSIVSIPTSKKAVRARMDDPVKFMVAQAARLTGHKYHPKILNLTRSKSDQVGLNFLQRQRNTEGLFEAKSGEGLVAVLDDVLTSGATLIAANQALHQAGYRVIANICVANTPKTLQY
jgi:predicted amidophosphoribosyltransferase